ncbi:hypothetical protein AX15_001071 [Amanita polypyramis BW_CC]|nr:hypothetical protein AX15_001071 [Amanita polypyramis BW_CC]
MVQYGAFQIVDAVLIYRCWIVYGHSWKIICLPIFFWTSGMALGSYLLYVYVLVVRNTSRRDIAQRLALMSYHIWEAYFVCNIMINVYATVSIVYRIARVARKSINHPDRLHQTWRIVAESGALYTLSTIMNLIATVVSGEGYELFELVADPINLSMAGIAFNLILIRVGQQRQQKTVGQDKSSSPQSVNNKIGPPLSTIRFHGTEATDSTLSQSSYILQSNTDQHV